MATLVSRITKGGPLSLEEYDANNDALNTELEAATAKTTVHPYYHFHGFAGNQVAGDGRFFDLAGINHGVRGDNLSDSQMFASAGYVSTVNPTGGAEDSTIHIPTLNFDHAGGEKLIVWWLGSGAPEGADCPIMGDGWSTTAGERGWRIRMKTNGKFDVALWGATQGNSDSSAGTVFDGTLHSLAVVWDGEAKTYGLWYDETYHYSTVLVPFNPSTTFDTTTIGTVNVGASRPASAASGSAADGAALKTRALVILRLPNGYAMPTVATFTTVFQQLRANPGKLILAGAF